MKKKKVNLFADDDTEPASEPTEPTQTSEPAEEPAAEAEENPFDVPPPGE